MGLVFLDVPEAAQINVGGNLNNCRFQGMNLSANDVTSINVSGDINDRSAFTSVTLDLNQTGMQAPNMTYLSQAVYNVIGVTSISAATLTTSLYYNPATHTLTYQNIPGVSLANVLNLLQNLTVQVYVNGVPQWADPPNDTIPLTTIASVLTSATAQALLAQFNADNVLGGVPAGAGVPSGAYGFTIGGGGTFDLSARNIDLGTTAGIQSDGVALYTIGGSYPLAQLFGNGGVFDRGADISVNVTGDLTMYSTSIASLNGGNIHVNVGGGINVGSADFTVNATGARGIYSGAPSDISVVAGGDVIVNGSRIAAYDGGNVTVESLTGNVDAGIGGMGFVVVNSFKVDPNTHQVTAFSPSIPGSGILATTIPTDDGQAVGNITILAAQNILLGCGSIIQLPLNGTDGGSSALTLQADGQILAARGTLFAPSMNLSGAILSAGSVNISAANAPGFLNPQVNVTNLTAVAGSNVQFNVNQVIGESGMIVVTNLGMPYVISVTGGSGLGPFSWQWYKNGTSLPDATNASLSLTNIHRTDAGTYSIVASNVTGTVTNDIQLHVLVPQLLSTSFVQTNQIMSVSFGDADGGLLTAQDIPSFVIQTSTNLVDWTSIDLPISTNASGGLSFQLPTFSDPGCGFYRILSQ